MSDGPLTKARIHTIEGTPYSVECLFNPKEYQVQRSNNWDKAPNSTSNAFDMTFQGGTGATLSLQLFFDTYLRSKGENQTSQDVRVHTEKLWQMMNIQLRDAKTHKGRPPRVLFSWGKSWLFNAVIMSMQQQYTLFTPSGMPVRAMVTVEFQETLSHSSVMAGGSRSETISDDLRQGRQDSDADLRKTYGR